MTLIDDSQAREAHRKQVQEIASIGSWVLDIEEDTLWWSDECYRIFDIPQSEPMSYERFLERVHPEDRERLDDAWNAALDGDGYDVRHRIVVDGETKWVREKADIEFDTQGHPKSGIGIVQDVTERMEREQALDAARQRFRTLLSSAPDPVFVADAQTGVLVEANDAAATFRGEPKEDIVGRHQTELHPSDATDSYRALFEQIVETGGARRRLADGTPIYAITESGEKSRVEISVDTVDLPDGPVKLGMYRDISEREARKRKLDEERAKYRAVVEQSNDAIIVVQNEELVMVNQEFVNLVGEKRPGDVEGDGFLKYVAPEYREMVTERYEARLRGDNPPPRYEIEAMSTNGEQLLVELNLSRIIYDGEPADMAVVRDVTKQKERERQLRQMKRAVESAGHAIYLTDRKGRIEYVNPAFEESTGYAAEDVLGENPRILKSGEHDREFYRHLWETILDGDVWRNEVVNTSKCGERYVADQTISPVEGPDGDIEGFVAVNMDVTKKRNQEREIRRQKRRYQSLFDSIRDAILVADTDRRIVNCNLAFTDLFGYELDEIEGKQTRFLYENDDDFEALGEMLTESEESDSPPTQEANYCKRSGQVFRGETNAFYLRNDDGDVVGFIGVIRDVSQRERRLQQVRVLDRILRHNLHNDMNVITERAKIIRDSATEPVTSNAEKIIDISEKFVEFADKQRKITTVLSDTPESETFDIVPVVNTTVAEVRRHHPGADVTTELPQKCLVTATQDIGEAIDELVTNAVVHSEHESPTVEVKVQPEHDTVEITVADDGPGIPEMERKVLTREEDIEPLYHGSGLGLWLAKLLAQQSNGSLRFEGQPSQGCLVTLVLPLAND